MDVAWWVASLSGLVVGFVVGLTGVGGGSLMTPILVYLGLPPVKAVGTDLLYAAITKAGGVLVHSRNRTVNWSVVGWLSLGSLPSSVITLAVLRVIHADGPGANTVIRLVLGVSLILTALSLILRPLFTRESGVPRPPLSARATRVVTVITGVFLGALVTLSSVGAGAIGAAALFILYPQLKTSKIVGVDLAHAVPLTLVAGLGHWALGTVHWDLLLSLLLGSLPGIALGSWLAPKTPERWQKPVMAVLLAGIGLSLV